MSLPGWTWTPLGDSVGAHLDELQEGEVLVLERAFVYEVKVERKRFDDLPPEWREAITRSGHPIGPFPARVIVTSDPDDAERGLQVHGFTANDAPRTYVVTGRKGRA
jgi:hypothetical protein